MTYKDKIKNNFSRYALHYDRHCDIQDVSGKALIEIIKGRDFRKILDIGCGTGNFTRALRMRYPDSEIKAVDISPEMIAVAKDKLKGEEIEFIIADAEEVKLDGTFDLIISNAVFQWFPNLDTSLSRYRELMSEGGAIIFSSFGPKTFFELGLVIKDALGPRNSSMTSHSFLGLDDIKSSLRAKFNDTYFEKRIYRRLYISLSELFDDIRYSGTRGLGVRSGGVWTKRTVNAVEESYKKRFGRIIATYEIFFCRGIK